LNKIANDDYHEIINVLANRAAIYLYETKITTGEGEKTINNFLDWIYEKK